MINDQELKEHTKKIKLKYKEVERCTKEYLYYDKELSKLNKDLTSSVESNVEEYYINKIKESIKDTELTQVNSKKKLAKGYDELLPLIDKTNNLGVLSDELTEILEASGKAKNNAQQILYPEQQSNENNVVIEIANLNISENSNNNQNGNNNLVQNSNTEKIENTEEQK